MGRHLGGAILEQGKQLIEQLDETHLFVDALFVDFIRTKLHQHMEDVVFTPAT